MKKLAKINLLGDVSLLSKDELKRIVGAASDGCKVNGYSCEGGACVTDGQGQSGTCGWNKGTYNCECLVNVFYSY